MNLMQWSYLSKKVWKCIAVGLFRLNENLFKDLAQVHSAFPCSLALKKGFIMHDRDPDS